LILGALFAISGIVLLIKGVGGEREIIIEVLALKLKLSAPGLLVFLAGVALIFVSTQMPGSIFGVSRQTATTAADASKAPRIEISTPADNTLATEEVKRVGENWMFRVKGTSEGLHGARGKVYLLYRDLSWPGWAVENPIPIPPGGKWEVGVWADAQTVGAARRYRFQLRAVATPEEFKPGALISLDFKTVKPPNADANAAGRPFQHTALSEAVELTLELPDSR
ncbi:MAG TPA: hypothetical protein VF754_07740, partial [Pyrinomonadaceae bacterium]